MNRHFSLLVALPLLALAAPAFADDVIEDVGKDLPNDPYTHTRGLTDGNIESFRELFVDPETFPASLAPKGTEGDGTILPIHNDRSSWATVVVNDTKVGIIGPYTMGYVKGVKAGSYDVNFTWSNGFSLTHTAKTVAKQDPPRSPGIVPVGMKAPGVE